MVDADATPHAGEAQSEIPAIARQRFSEQRSNAQQRGIPFLFSLQEWWDWWQIDGRWERRGLKGNGLVMARHGDTGPYSPDNVKCVSNAENTREVASVKRGAHFRVRGADHPASKAVITPMGRFDNALLAAAAHGIEHSTAARRAREKRAGWAYESTKPVGSM